MLDIRNLLQYNTFNNMVTNLVTSDILVKNTKGGNVMNVEITEGIREEDVMTDFQFKSIMKMVLEIVEGKDNVEDVKKTIAKLAGEAGKQGVEADEKVA